MSRDKNSLNRRNVLRGIGTGTAGLSLGFLSQGAAAVSPKRAATSVEDLRGASGNQLIAEAVSDDATKAVLREARKLGFTAKIGHAEAKEFSVPSSGDSEEGVRIPLAGSPERDAVWDDVDASAPIMETADAYVTWYRPDDNAGSACLILLGIAADGDSTASDDAPFIERYDALKVVTPERTYTDTLDGEERSNGDADGPSSGDGGGISIQTHTVRHCYLENNSIIEHADDAITCGTCLVPGEGLGIGDVAQCLWCIYQLEKAACVIGYCQDESGGSTGDTFCSIADTIATTPFWLLPISGGDGLKVTAEAVSYGCSSNESTDCTSPLVD